jgi:hypothetical protein
MRDLKKNQVAMFYALYSDSIPVYDDQGRETLETKCGYLHPVSFKASISAGRSDAYESPFGNNVAYDRVILSSNKSLPINDNSLIWVDNIPVYDTDGSVLVSSADYQVSANPIKTLNVVKIAVKMLTANKS